jgi:intraflagellar transport protein 88
MKSNASAGFKSKPVQEGVLAGQQPTIIEEKKEKSEEENFKEIEEEVHRLLEQSATLKVKKNLNDALTKAKEAASKEKKIRQLREAKGSLDQVNIDLTFYVFYNLANMYHANGLHTEALNSYTIILKNKQYPQASRLRVNMGNIYFEQKKYDQAIKMYNMALDSTTNQNKEMKLRIKRNVALALVKQKRFGKAIEVYEDIMNDTADHDVGFNLIVCLYALGEREKMRTWFERLLMIDIPGTDEEEQEELAKLEKKDDDKPMGDVDPLKQYLRGKKKEALGYISSSAKLVAPFIEQDIFVGYDYVCEALKAANLPEVESEMEIQKAICFIKTKEIEKAIESFKAFEKKDKIMMALASNNISFLYFLENDFKSAESFADLAIQHDRYNSKALVNKGNCLFVSEDYDRSKEFFLEAIGVEADCIEAIYNLGLVYKRLGYYNESLQAFEKLHTIIPNSYEVIYQIAHVYELIGMRRQALKWYNILITKVPSDSEILAKMGYLYQQEQDEFQAVHFYQESYRYNPAKIDVISCLGMHHAKNDMFEKAIVYFERAQQIQPKENKWSLMIASCFRRMNLFNEALKVYEDIYE